MVDFFLLQALDYDLGTSQEHLLSPNILFLRALGTGFMAFVLLMNIPLSKYIKNAKHETLMLATNLVKKILAKHWRYTTSKDRGAHAEKPAKGCQARQKNGNLAIFPFRAPGDFSGHTYRTL
jgi:hypothetical protein